MIKAIILDCFGVLYIPVGEDFYAANVPEYEKHRQELSDLWLRGDRGHISHTDVVAHVAKLTGLDTNTVHKGLVGGWARNQALLDFCQTFRPACKVGLLTNMSPGVMDTYFTQVDRQHFFDAVVVSSQEGIIKPDTRIYKLAASRLGVDPSECLLIDDSPQNCQGAIDVGMQAILYLNTEQVVAAIGALVKK